MEDTIWLQRPSEDIPWGFRLQGGRDFQQPLTVQKVTCGSVAASSLNSGDIIVRIGDAETALLTHAQAMSKIKSCGNTLDLGISRGGENTTIMSPKVGNYSLHPQADALHETTAAGMAWPQISDSPIGGPPRTVPHNPHLVTPEYGTTWQSNSGLLRQNSGAYNPSNVTHQNDSYSEPLFGTANRENQQSQGYAVPPTVVVGTPKDGQAEVSSEQETFAPPPPPPPPPSSPSPALRPWNSQNGANDRSKVQQKTYPETSNDYSSSYPFGEPSTYSNDSGFGQGSPVSNGQQIYGGHGGDYDLDSSYSTDAIHASPQKPKSTPPTPQRMPDAILNMAAKGEGDKKPFSYIADVNDIKEQRDRVRKKTPVCTLPRYQHMLNMPQFEDPPRARGTPRTPATPPVQNPESGEAVVANLQFNSPLQLYSSDNVVEALKGQTGGAVADVVGLSKKDNKADITQSAVYKMIHGIDQPKSKPVVKFAEGQPTVHENTGGSEIDTTSIRRNVSGEDSDPGQYDEKSIRYTGRNIPSKSFRLLQSMTGGAGDDSTPPTVRRQLREPSSDDEVRFSGLNRSVNVPSKTFQRLQIKTRSAGASPSPVGASPSPVPHTQQGGSEIDRTSIRQNLNLGDDLQDPGQYEQTSIRYTGRNIPSKSFRMLQSLTGGAGSESPPPGHPRRQQRRPPHEPEGGEKQNPDEGVDIRYVGGHIPSQSFKMLQHCVGANDTPAQDNADGGRSDTLASSQGRRVKVVRLRSQASQEDSGSTDF